MKTVRELLLVIAAAGLLGFLGCFAIGTAADWRLEAHPEYRRTNAERTVLIRTKYHEGFVAPSYAERFNRSEDWTTYFWIVALLGSLGWFALKKDGSNE